MKVSLSLLDFHLFIYYLMTVTYVLWVLKIICSIGQYMYRGNCNKIEVRQNAIVLYHVQTNLILSYSIVQVLL